MLVLLVLGMLELPRVVGAILKVHLDSSIRSAVGGLEVQTLESVGVRPKRHTRVTRVENI